MAHRKRKSWTPIPDPYEEQEEDETEPLPPLPPYNSKQKETPGD